MEYLVFVISVTVIGLIGVALCMYGIITQRWLDLVLGLIFLLVLTLGWAEKSEAAEPQWSVGTLTSSYHYNRSHDYNESHQGFFVGRDKVAAGHFTNSFGDSSWFMSYHEPINTWASYGIHVATGYEVPLMPMVSVTLHKSIFYLEVTPIVAVVGLKFNIGGE